MKNTGSASDTNQPNRMISLSEQTERFPFSQVEHIHRLPALFNLTRSDNLNLHEFLSSLSASYSQIGLFSSPSINVPINMEMNPTCVLVIFLTYRASVSPAPMLLHPVDTLIDAPSIFSGPIQRFQEISN